jgi:hypothetical protein
MATMGSDVTQHTGAAPIFAQFELWRQMRAQTSNARQCDFYGEFVVLPLLRTISVAKWL